MFDRPVATSLEDVIEAYQIALDIGIGIGDRVSDTRLCGEVHHHGRLILFEEAVYRRFVGYISLDEAVVRALRHQAVELIQAPLLQCHIVVTVHIIDIDNRSPLHVFEQALDEVRADEASSTGYQYRLSIQVDFIHMIQIVCKSSTNRVKYKIIFGYFKKIRYLCTRIYKT